MARLLVSSIPNSTSSLGLRRGCSSAPLQTQQAHWGCCPAWCFLRSSEQTYFSSRRRDLCHGRTSTGKMVVVEACRLSSQDTNVSSTSCKPITDYTRLQQQLLRMLREHAGFRDSPPHLRLPPGCQICQECLRVARVRWVEF